MAKRIELAQMRRKDTSDKIRWDDLLLRELRESYGRNAKLRNTWKLDDDKKEFLRCVFADARNIDDSTEPEEISKTTVDVNEKVYSNHHGSDDETTVKLVSTMENAEGHNYSVSTTSGVEWGGGADLGLQFGLPQGASLKVGGNASFKKFKSKTVTNEDTKTSKVESQAHHEETVKIPPGKTVVVKMTSYRVRYKLPYTMEYKVPKTKGLLVSYDPCGIGLCCMSSGYLTATQLMHTLPGFREDAEYVYFTQQGELRWIADRMVVDKKVLDL